ncbi:SLC13 family permease [Pseudactinotalea terrae]|uniref:SLC13 family permease n=1 Tax=Pseudactinotalea terrae TaxID=1743262 RepID=UPI0012E256D4|nr:SLC13 family permease [Pseudactinotalea terrae]
MSDATTSLVVLAATVALFIWNRLPVGIVAVISALALYVTGLVDSTTAVAGFGEPIVVFIVGLFMVSEGLDASGVTGWAGQTLVRRVGTRRAALLLGLTALAALMGAFVTPNGSAAALLPVTVVAARRAGVLPATLLMPVAFAASAGALLVLSGSTVNVIVSDALHELTGEGFGFFEFALIGGPLVLVTMVVCLAGAGRLVPHRDPIEQTADLSGHVDTLIEGYTLEQGFYRLLVPAGSSLVGKIGTSVATAAVTPIALQRPDGASAPPDAHLADDDVLILSGSSEQVESIRAEHGLSVLSRPLTRGSPGNLLSDAAGIAEVVVPPRSRLVGERVYPGTTRGELTLLTVGRFGRSRGPQGTVLHEGDMLLLHGPWAAVNDLARESDVLLISDPDLIRRQNAPLGRRAWLALGVLAVTVALLATGITSPAISALVGAGLMVLTRVITPYQAYRAVSWQTVVLIGGLIPLSVAIASSGAADLIADLIVDLVAGTGPRVLLALLFAVTVVLGQAVSNTATVLIVAPIALAAGEAAGVGPAPVLMLVAVAGAASFLTPIATPANMIVMGAGGYRFGDYWRLGLVLTLVWFVVAVALIPLIWGS